MNTPNIGPFRHPTKVKPKQEVKSEPTSWHELDLAEKRRQRQGYTVDEHGNKRWAMPPIGPFKQPTNQVQRGADWSNKTLTREHKCWECKTKFTQLPFSKEDMFCSENCKSRHTYSQEEKDYLRKHDSRKWQELITEGVL